MINRLFLFAIGGTGSRVLKALVMLLAGGAPINAREIVVIIIDPDIQNGNLTDTEQLLKKYRDINNACVPAAAGAAGGFFRPKISTFYNLSNDGTITRDSFTFDFGANINTTFNAFINYNTLPPQDQMFMNVLFSQNNLNSNLDIGFKGHPNVGSIVLNTFDNSAEFALFQRIFNNTTDRVFVISSIFGGTGAAGFPLLVQLMRNNTDDKINQALIGALSVGPYFNIAKPNQGDEAIDPTIFVTKMKAALSYYEKNLTNLDTIYYLSDTVLSNPEGHDLGGPNQKNNAHFIELIGASSIIHFCALAVGVLRPPGTTDIVPKAYEHYLNPGTDTNINLQKLGRASANEVIGKPLVILKYLSRLLHYLEANSLNRAWATQIGYNTAYLHSATYQSIKYVLREYVQWLHQMQNNMRLFQPFNLNATVELKNLIEGKSIKDGLVRRFDEDLFDRAFGNLYDKEPVSNLTGTDQKFLALMWKGVYRVYDGWIKSIS